MEKVTIRLVKVWSDTFFMCGSKSQAHRWSFKIMPIFEHSAVLLLNESGLNLSILQEWDLNWKQISRLSKICIRVIFDLCLWWSLSLWDTWEALASIIFIQFLLYPSFHPVHLFTTPLKSIFWLLACRANEFFSKSVRFLFVGVYFDRLQVLVSLIFSLLWL